MTTTFENRIRKTIIKKGGDILNVYFTAGYPDLDSTEEIILLLEKSGVDLIELGMPYSDPLADGLTIQQSSEVALKNGMRVSLLFEQVTKARKSSSIPIILMGYYNQVLQYGLERFLNDATVAGIDGMIIPDLPMGIFERECQDLFKEYGMGISFLISPMTSEERIVMADRLSTAFIYVVSQSSITGNSQTLSEQQKAWFKRIKEMDLKSPALIGFGIHDRQSYKTACDFSHGAIIGSAFIRVLGEDKPLQSIIPSFIQSIRQ